MTPEQKMPTIRRDVLDVYRRLERARDGIDRRVSPQAWNEVDLALARLQGLSFFIGPWEKEILDSVAV